MAQHSTQICIVGGGFGGLYTALALSRYAWRNIPRPQITLVDPKQHFLFTPLFYELLTEELQAWEIAPSFEKLLANTGIHFYQDAVDSVDLHQQQVKLKSGKMLNYDRLVLAAGRQTKIDPVCTDATNLYSFRSLIDAERLKQRLEALEVSALRKIRVAVVGAGPSGVELACKLADRLKSRGDIRLLDRRKVLLRDFSSTTQKAAQSALASRGIRLELESQIQNVECDRITFNQQGQTQVCPIDLVVWATGTQSWDWLSTLNCQQTPEGQLLTAPTLQLTEHSNVFAIGDLAVIQASEPQHIPATAQAASQQAKIVAHNLRASLLNQPLRSFSYRHLGEMLTLGIRAAVVSSPQLCCEGAIAYWIRSWAYVFRLPTLQHRLQVVGYRLIQPFLSLKHIFVTQSAIDRS